MADNLSYLSFAISVECEFFLRSLTLQKRDRVGAGKNEKGWVEEMDAKKWSRGKGEREERRHCSFYPPSTLVDEEIKQNQTVTHYHLIRERTSFCSNRKEEGCHLRIKGSSLNWISLTLWNIYFFILLFLYSPVNWSNFLSVSCSRGTSALTQGSPIFSIQDEIINILGFGGHTLLPVLHSAIAPRTMWKWMGVSVCHKAFGH